MGDNDSTLVEMIVEEVAQHKAVDATSLEEPLYTAINPEALETLFRETSGEVSFRYLDLLVSVTSDRTVEVRNTDRHRTVY